MMKNDGPTLMPMIGEWRCATLAILLHMRHRVFDLFTQVQRPGSPEVEGMGIGLALVQRLVYLHSGTVTATSAGRGCGSPFTVCLPSAGESLLVAPC